MHRTGTTRRGALTATGAFALGAVLAGCGGGQEAPGSPAAADARSASLRAGKALRAAAARDSVSLLSRYDLVAAAHPVAEAGLAPLRATVREHLSALGEPAKASGGSPAPAPPAAAPTDPRAALRELAAEERLVSDVRAAALLTAEPELARLLASVAAAGAAHAYLLTELAKETSS